MAATNSTNNLGLPQWLETDKPERTDFNTAFDEIDDAIGSLTLTWTTVTTFSNNWVDTFPSTWPVQYSKDALGIVRLRGFINGGSNNSTAFTLPEGFRPNRNVMFVTISYATSSDFKLSVVYVNSSGEVKINKPSVAAGAYIPLDVIAFDTN